MAAVSSNNIIKDYLDEQDRLLFNLDEECESFDGDGAIKYDLLVKCHTIQETRFIVFNSLDLISQATAKNPEESLKTLQRLYTVPKSLAELTKQPVRTNASLDAQISFTNLKLGKPILSKFQDLLLRAHNNIVYIKNAFNKMPHSKNARDCGRLAFTCIHDALLNLGKLRRLTPEIVKDVSELINFKKLDEFGTIAFAASNGDRNKMRIFQAKADAILKTDKLLDKMRHREEEINKILQRLLGPNETVYSGRDLGMFERVYLIKDTI